MISTPLQNLGGEYMKKYMFVKKHAVSRGFKKKV